AVAQALRLAAHVASCPPASSIHL
ncbi:hypothetical protein KIPB_014524, partial [Kipferlia bialata]